MSFKWYIIFVPLFALLATSCWTGKFTTAKAVEIDNREIGLQQWQSSSESYWRLAIDDSIAWRRHIIERRFDDNQQLISETITEESIDHRHEEKQEAAEADDEEGDTAIIVSHQEQKKTEAKASSKAMPIMSAIGLLVIFILLLYIIGVFCKK